ncbi:MAG: carboxypeptidase regulatory-like domain-containing protein [Gemmatimonadaceae bacterium]|nr:carboxypeptidase regulatory-like domain-containing protein [Gemmatimonadaceae bacterium]
MRVWAAAVLALLSTAVAAAGQELRGTLFTNDSLHTLSGVLVEATDRSGARAAVSLSDSRGKFVLSLPAGRTLSLRALRIGYRPAALGEIELAPGDTVERAFYASAAAIVLDEVMVAESQRCGRLGESGRRAATLFGEARKAIEASRLEAGGAELSAVWSLYSRRRALNGRPLGEAQQRQYEGSTARPFASAPADSLEAHGYVREIDGEMQFFAPDADVLLSDSFARTHCFQAVDGEGPRAGQVGVAFRPAPERRNLPEIAGTFWLNAKTLELNRLEFEYVGLPPVFSGRTAGGDVGFAKLSTGSWLVGEWSIRMPRVSVGMERVVGRTSRPITRVRSLEETGGIVQAVRLGGRVVLERRETGDFDAPALDAETVALLCHSPLGARDAVV